MYTLKYKRYGVDGKKQFKKLKRAMDSAAVDIEFNNAYPVEIVSVMTGKVVRNHKDIVKHCHKIFG